MKAWLLISLMMWTVMTQAQTGLVVVVAKDSGVEAISSQQVSNIFLSKTQSFPDGSKATPIELKEHALKEAFYASISGKSNSQLSAYWTTLVFTGKGKPPKGYKSSDKLIQNLVSMNGAITYLPADLVTNDMKVIYRFP
ncbi:MAG: phosphate ABC transporter substrate-binding protein [Marinicella sp.]